MATKTYKVLGQLLPSAATLGQLYLTPNAAQAICSTLSICNQDMGATKLAVAIVPSGRTLGPESYILKDFPFDGSDSDFLVLGMTLNSGDQVLVSSTNGAVSFNLFGEELT